MNNTRKSLVANTSPIATLVCLLIVTVASVFLGGVGAVAYGFSGLGGGSTTVPALMMVSGLASFIAVIVLVIYRAHLWAWQCSFGLAALLICSFFFIGLIVMFTSSV